MEKTALTEEMVLKALFATKTLLSTKKKGAITQVWKGSQHLGDFSKEEGSVKACRYCYRRSKPAVICRSSA